MLPCGRENRFPRPGPPGAIDRKESIVSEKTKPSTLSRREVAGLAAGAAALAATPALAKPQPNMEKALAYCQEGLKHLKAAAANKGGHRAKAIEHLEYVIKEIKAGIKAAS
jgi:hypothetical protein